MSTETEQLESRLEARLNQVTDAIGEFARAQEVKDIRARLSTKDVELDAAVTTAERAVDTAETALAAALEDGEAPKIARAQRMLSESVADRESAKAARASHQTAVRNLEKRLTGSQGAPTTGGGGGGGGQQQQLDTKNVDQWKGKHSTWYGVDADMTKAAHSIHDEISEAGVIAVGSQEYFQAIDRKMAQRFPDRFNSAPETAGGGSGGAPARVDAGRIPKEVIEGWARMGINTKDDATMKRMVGHRETLVDKGIMPDRPAYGAVR